MSTFAVPLRRTFERCCAPRRRRGPMQGCR